MNTIVVTNRKGGAGKTTVAVNTASQLALGGKRVLLIDLDTQGHCAVGLGISVQRETPTVHDIFVTSDATLRVSIVPTCVTGLFLSPANPFYNHGLGDNTFKLQQALQEENIAADYDFVIIDTPPSMDTLLLNGIMAANYVVVPFIPHHLSFEGARQLIRALFPIMTKEHRTLKILGFIPTQASDRLKLHLKVKGQMGREFGDMRLLPPIHSDIHLAESFSVGKPIQLFAPHSRGAEDFAQLTQELLSRL
jgi:chromosome partitioning protein